MENKKGDCRKLDSSGFVEDIKSECMIDIGTMIPTSFSDIRTVYQSVSGPSMLLTAMRFGKRYILKCLKEDYRYTPFHQLALAKEFEIGISLDHPNIVKTIGFEDVDGLGKCIVMEYVDGESLHDLLNRKKLTPSEARGIANQLLAAVSYAHSKQIIHRDIKPENVMVTHSGNVVKLIDFGLSDGNSYTIIKIPSGTRSYMAPEQMKEGAKADVAADIYSIGVLINDLGMNAGDPGLLKIADRCIANDPVRRPLSAADIHISQKPSVASELSSLHSKKLTSLLSFILAVLTYFVCFLAWKHL